MSIQILQSLAAMPRRLWDALAIPLLGAVGLWFLVELVLVISRGLTQYRGNSLLLALGMLAGLLLLIWVTLKPETGLYLFIVTFPLTNENVLLPVITISLPNILLVALGLGLIARRLLGDSRQRPENSVFKPKIFLLSWLILATIVSALITYSQATARFLITRVGYALTLLVILAVISDAEKLKKALRLLVWSAAAAAIVTIVGGFFPYAFPLELVRCNEPLLPILNTPRCSAFNLTFHSLGHWLLIGLAPAIGSIAYPKLLGLSRRLAVGLALLLMSGLVIGQVRGAWVALVVSLPIILIFAMRPKGRNGFVVAIYAVSMSAFAVCAAYLIWNFALQPIINFRPDTFFARLESYRIAWQYFGEHWLFGIGPLDERFLALEPMGYGVVENVFIVETAATGILGAIPFLLLWFGAFHSSVKVFDAPVFPELRKLAGIILLGLLWVMLSIQAHVGIGEKAPWIMLGIAAGMARIQATAMSTKWQT